MNEEELLKLLREAFKEEAVERLASLSNCLLQLERVAQDDVAQSESLEVAFREAHSLKGAARSVSLLDVEALFQSMESVLSRMKRTELVLEIYHFDVLHDCVAMMENFLTSFAADSDASCRDSVAPLLEQLELLQQGKLPGVPAAVVSEPSSDTVVGVDLDLTMSPSDVDPDPIPESSPTSSSVSSTSVAAMSVSDTTLRVSSARLDEVMRKAEGMIVLKLAAAQRHVEAEQLGTILPVWKKQWKRSSHQWRRNMKCLDSLTIEECRATIEQMSSYLDQTQHHFQTMETGVTQLKQALFHDSAAVNTMVEELLDDVKEIIMVPFSNAAASFPRMVREISRTQGKQVEFTVSGEDVELDKRILDKIVSPLTHLLRNAIDHGIELPQERVASGKDAAALVAIALGRTKGGQIEIRISDDGGGIDVQRLRDKAVAQGLMTQEAAELLRHDEAIDLIFNSGLSTSAILTEISGRGLGMAIVKDEVEQLGGHVHVETILGKGSCFKLHLPVSLSIFRGILVHVRGHDLVLPTTAVERVIKVARSAIKSVENREVIVIDGVNLALVEMGDILSISEKPITCRENIQVAVVCDSGQRLGFVVDTVAGEYELLVKGLGHQLQGMRFFSGASVLGDGRIVPILDPRDLLAAPKDGGSTRSIRDASVAGKVHRILAVDDSITSRMLIKNILEAAGYLVVSAVDGMDGYAKVTESVFDLVVSDVEMPRMNGFELTTQIRETESVARIPVVLVTSLESIEDKEKGIVAGANAYIVKRSFDQTNLLDTVKRLL